MRKIKKLIKELFKSVGLSISKIENVPKVLDPPASPLVYHRIDLLLDVGANEGQYTASVRAQGFQNKIVSFEPLSKAYKILKENSQDDDQWIVHERCAVGAALGETEINVSQNSQSSSLLPMLAAHSNAAPESIYIAKDKTKIITLDSVFDTYYRANQRVFLKIDTQGYEKQVLEGATNSLKHIIGVQLELSIVPLYGSQALYEYFFQFFKDHGFNLWSLIPGFYDPETGQLLQFDAVFVRPN